MGSLDAVAVLHLPPRARARRDGPRWPARRVLADAVGDQRRTRSPGPSNVRGLETGLVRAGAASQRGFAGPDQAADRHPAYLSGLHRPAFRSGPGTIG